MRLLSIVPTLLLLLCLPLSGCSGKDNGNGVPPRTEEVLAEEELSEAASIAKLREDTLRQAASRIAASLDDRQLAAQVIISGIDGKGHLTKDMEFLLTECPAGGIILFRYNLDTDTDAIQSLIAETGELITSKSAVPPFVAVDHEGGVVNRFRRGVADLPPAAFYGEMAHNVDNGTFIKQISDDSYNAGKAINNLGINMNLAPVAEYLHDDNRDFLDDRAYSSDPDITYEAALRFIMRMRIAGVLCVVKHFPGSAGTDPHYFSSVLNGDREALADLTAPIAKLIRTSNLVRAIMVSHTAVPAWDNTIASLSPVVMGEWLRGELGFEGIIISDDFSMGAAVSATSATGDKKLKPETAAVMSLAAGADMVLVWPPDLRRTHRAIMAALAAEAASADDAPTNGGNGVFHERLREAAGRIIFEKIRMSLIHDE